MARETDTISLTMLNAAAVDAYADEIAGSARDCVVGSSRAALSDLLRTAAAAASHDRRWLMQQCGREIADMEILETAEAGLLARTDKLRVPALTNAMPACTRFLQMFRDADDDTQLLAALQEYEDCLPYRVLRDDLVRIGSQHAQVLDFVATIAACESSGVALSSVFIPQLCADADTPGPASASAAASATLHVEVACSPEVRGLARSRGFDGHLPITFAAEKGFAGVCAHLLDVCGAEVDAVNQKRDTALNRAAKNGHISSCKALVARGADLDKGDKAGKTPLMQAAFAEQAACCLWLMKAGANVRAVQGAKGVTALHAAAQNGMLRLCKALLDNGADVNHPMRSGSGPLAWAAERGREDVCELLVRRGADINARGNTGFNPLGMSVVGDLSPESRFRGPHLRTFERLLELGAEPTLLSPPTSVIRFAFMNLERAKAYHVTAVLLASRRINVSDAVHSQVAAQLELQDLLPTWMSMAWARRRPVIWASAIRRQLERATAGVKRYTEVPPATIGSVCNDSRADEFSVLTPN